MRGAETILGIIHDRDKRALPLEDVYRQLFNPTLYLLAYGKIYRNQGAMTRGVTEETVDGMSVEKVQTIIEAIRHERFVWSPTRRVYIEKKNSTKKRPLGIPTWSDKVVQEVIRLLLEAYYEPQFSNLSHGFRPNRGCHTALTAIRHYWKGTAWFIEGDIKGCFDNIDHTILLSILREKIHDNRFIRLIENLLKAGYLGEWRYNATYSGTPQGGILSPLLSNIYLDRLDSFAEQELLPNHTRGTRERNPEYERLIASAWHLKKTGHTEEARKVRAQAQTLPSRNANDPDNAKLRYIRYADDFLLGFNGTRKEAEVIKQELRRFLTETLRLELSEEKTLITHARTRAARFLGYDIVTLHNDSQLDDEHRRRINAAIGLKVPKEVIQEKSQAHLRNGKPTHRTELMNDTEFSIIQQFQGEYRGIVEYYRLAFNLHQFDILKWVMEQALTKTLAAKLQIHVREVYARFGTSIQTDNGTRPGLQVVIERKGKKPLVAQWGGISLKWKKEAKLCDEPYRTWNTRTEAVDRLLAEECELCGSKERIEVHHVRALKDLQKKGQGEKPEWVKRMAARQRKTLAVCHECHVGPKGIHAGRYDGKNLRR
jgi:group II intron reverse transcriptase/maturase